MFDRSREWAALSAFVTDPAAGATLGPFGEIQHRLAVVAAEIDILAGPFQHAGRLYGVLRSSVTDAV